MLKERFIRIIVGLKKAKPGTKSVADSFSIKTKLNTICLHYCWLV